MPLRTVGLGRHIASGLAPCYIFLLSHGLQVSRVYAASIPTQAVKLQTLGYGANDILVSKPVRRHFSALEPETPIPTTALSGNPLDAPGQFVSNNLL